MWPKWKRYEAGPNLNANYSRTQEKRFEKTSGILRFESQEFFLCFWNIWKEFSIFVVPLARFFDSLSFLPVFSSLHWPLLFLQTSAEKLLFQVDLEQFEQRSLVDDANSLPQILEGFYTTPSAPTDALGQKLRVETSSTTRTQKTQEKTPGNLKVYFIFFDTKQTYYSIIVWIV